MKHFNNEHRHPLPRTASFLCWFFPSDDALRGEEEEQCGKFRRFLMKWKMLSVCVALTSLLFTCNAFAEKPFVHKIVGGGSVYQSVQTLDGSYAYLDGSHFTKIHNVSDDKTSKISFSFDVPYDGYVSFTNMAPTSTGYALVGYAQTNGYYGVSSALVVKLDSKGKVEWNKTFTFTVGNGSGTSSFDSVVPTADGGLIVTGGTYVEEYHPILIKFSAQGEVLWSKSFESLSWSFRSISSGDDGLILAADIFSSDGRFIGANVIKINDAGNIVWAKTLKTEGFGLHSMTPLMNGGLLLVGKRAGVNTLLLIRLNADGTFRSKSAYSLNAPDFIVMSVAQTPDGGSAIGGTLQKGSASNSDGFLLKVDDHQKLVFQKNLSFQNNSEGISSVIVKEDGTFLLFGSTGAGSQGPDTLLISLKSNGSVPGCNFSHDFTVSKVQFGRVQYQNLSIAEGMLSVPTPGSIKIKAKRSHVPISDACQ
jgi:hypothetical protein